MSPVTGKVITGNALLEETPSVLNAGPEKEGWIAKLEVKDPSEIDGLMDAEAYQSSLDTE